MLLKKTIGIQQSKKKTGFSFVLLLLLITGLLIYLAFVFDFYPGGYSFNVREKEVIIGGGKVIEITKENELKLAILDTRIESLKTLWYISVLFTTTQFIFLVNFLSMKDKKAFRVYLPIFIAIYIALVVIYMMSINDIESLLLNF